MISQEQRLEVTFRGITRHLADEGLQLQEAISTVVSTEEFLFREITTLSESVQKVNLLLGSANYTQGLAAVNHIRTILTTKDALELPVPFAYTNRPERQHWTQALMELIKTGNKETGTIYRKPNLINNGNPPDVFRWYLWDGWGRFTAITLGIPNTNKEQEIAGGWFTGAAIEAAVILAEQGEKNQLDTVRSMLKVDFISDGYPPTHEIFPKANVVAQESE